MSCALPLRNGFVSLARRHMPYHEVLLGPRKYLQKASSWPQRPWLPSDLSDSTVKSSRPTSHVGGLFYLSSITALHLLSCLIYDLISVAAVGHRVHTAFDLFLQFVLVTLAPAIPALRYAVTHPGGIKTRLIPIHYPQVPMR